MGACSQQKCMSLQAQSSAQAEVRWIPTVRPTFGKRKQKQSRILTLEKTQTTLHVRRSTLNARVSWWHISATQHNVYDYMSKTGQAPEFSRQDHSREHAQRHHQLHKQVRRCRERECLDTAKEVASHAAEDRIQTWSVVFLWSRIGTDQEINRVKTCCSFC